MLKILGMLFIFGGIAGVLFSWNTAEKTRLQQMDDLLLFLEKAKYRMEIEKIKIPQLLQDFIDWSDEKSAITLTFQDVLSKLKENRAPSPEQVWREIFTFYKSDWNLTKESWQIALRIGNGLFGTNLNENVEVLSAQREELKELRQQEQRRWKEKQKVFTPVGILAGGMLVIILL